MKFIALCLAFFPIFLFCQNVGIGTNNPDPSATLEIKSSSGGVLIPRLTLTERNMIPNPIATGLLIYNSNNQRFEFWDGNAWRAISAASSIADLDGDTHIQVEQTSDEDTIRLQAAGFPIAKIDNQTLHLEAESHGIFIGLNAGKSIPGTESWNTFIGHKSGEQSTSGISNTFLGANSGRKGDKGNSNVFIGAASGEENIGDNNTFLGIVAGQLSSSGSDNTYVGAIAGGQNTGSRNIGIGYLSSYLGNGNNNIGIGRYSLYNVPNGKSNLIAIGDSTLHMNGIDATIPFWGIDNVAVGSKALKMNTRGSSNTAIGNYSLENNSIGLGNVGIGNNSLNNNTSGTFNTAIGAVSSYTNINGSRNTTIGHSSGRVNQSGSNNTFVGYESGDNSTSGENTFVGSRSGLLNNSGSSNTFIGYNAGVLNTDGGRNTSIGSGSGGSGSSNVSIGFAAGKTSTAKYSVGIGDSTLMEDEGHGSVAIGSKAGISNRNGDRNIYIGDSAGFNQVNGDENIFLGYRSGGFSSGAEGAIAIGTRAGLLSGQESISIGYESNMWGAVGNISIGKQAGHSSTGQNSIYLGNYMGYDNSENHRLFIGNLAYGTLIYGEMENRIVEVKNHLYTGSLRLRAPLHDSRLYMKTKDGNEGRVLVKQNNTEDIHIGDIDNQGNDVVFWTAGMDRMILNPSGNLGLGMDASSSRFAVDAVEDQDPMTIRYRGVAKMKVHQNGGISLGSDALPPMDGILVHNLANSGDHPLRVNDAGIIYKDEQNKYKSYSPPSFVDNPLTGIVSANSTSWRNIPGGTFVWTDWDLPHLSKAKTFKIYFQADTDESIRVEIFRKNINNGNSPTELANNILVGAGNNVTSSGSIVLNETIDNQNYSYFFRVWNEASSTVLLYGVTQSYQM